MNMFTVFYVHCFSNVHKYIYMYSNLMYKFFNIHNLPSAFKQSTFKTSSSNPLEFPQQLRPTFMASLGQLDMQGDPKPKPPAPGTVSDKEVMFGSVVGRMVAENSQFSIFPVGYGGWSRNSST